MMSIRTSCRFSVELNIRRRRGKKVLVSVSGKNGRRRFEARSEEERGAERREGRTRKLD